MHIVENKSKSGKKIYRSIFLQESYREEGKVRKHTIANLSNCAHQEKEPIKLALSHKDDLSALGALSESVELQEGMSVGGGLECVPGGRGIRDRGGIGEGL